MSAPETGSLGAAPGNQEQQLPDGLARRLAQQNARGELGFDYDYAIHNADTRQQKEKLIAMREAQLRLRERKRKAAVDNGTDEKGQVVLDKYAPKAKLVQAAVDEDEFKKMIPSSSPSLYKNLRVEEVEPFTSAVNSGEHSQFRVQDTTGDVDEDMAVYGDIFSDEGLHEAAGANLAGESKCTVIDLQEGVLAKLTPSISSRIFDKLFGGTFIDKSGRKTLEQRPLVKGGRPKKVLVNPALKQILQEFRTCENLIVKGIPSPVLRAHGWLTEGHMKDQIKPRGWWAAHRAKEQLGRVAEYDKMPLRVGGIPTPADLLGMPNLEKKRKRGADAMAGDAEGLDNKGKRRKGHAGKVLFDALVHMSTRGKMKFAEDA